MAELTIQVIQGLEAGRVLRDLPTPITIGREEENLVQLNDERISRFHAKIQAKGDQFILTDLESTNGTRVNGHFTSMRTIQIGDQIALGRCILLVGSPQELEELQRSGAQTAYEGRTHEDGPVEAFPFGPPETPEGLSPQQAATVATLLEFFRTKILNVLNSIYDEDQAEHESVQLPKEAWHQLQMLPPHLAQYLEELSNPHQENE